MTTVAGATPERPYAWWRSLRAIIVGLAGSLIAMLAFVLAGLALLPLTGGYAMVVTGGSMEPNVRAGDVVVLEKVTAEEVREGDVITFQGYGTSTLTTHRVVSLKRLPTGLHYQTKGDANGTMDPNLAPAKGLRGRVAVTLPGLGRAALLLRDPWLRVALLGGPSAFWVLQSLSDMVGGKVTRPSTPRRRKRPMGINAKMAVMALTAASVTAGAAVLFETSATYADVVPVSDNAFSTALSF